MAIQNTRRRRQLLPNSASCTAQSLTLDATSRLHLLMVPDRSPSTAFARYSSVATADVIRICTQVPRLFAGRRGVGNTQKQRWRAGEPSGREGWGAQRAAPWDRERASSSQPGPIRTGSRVPPPQMDLHATVSASQRLFGGLCMYRSQRDSRRFRQWSISCTK